MKEVKKQSAFSKAMNKVLFCLLCFLIVCLIIGLFGLFIFGGIYAFIDYEGVWSVICGLFYLAIGLGGGGFVVFEAIYTTVAGKKEKKKALASSQSVTENQQKENSEIVHDIISIDANATINYNKEKKA